MWLDTEALVRFRFLRVSIDRRFGQIDCEYWHWLMTFSENTRYAVFLNYENAMVIREALPGQPDIQSWNNTMEKKH